MTFDKNENTNAEIDPNKIDEILLEILTLVPEFEIVATANSTWCVEDKPETNLNSLYK